MSLLFLTAIHNANGYLTETPNITFFRVTYTNKNKEKENEIDVLDNDEVIILRQCGHLFNANALILWLQNNNTCPVCNVNVRFNRYKKNIVQVFQKRLNKYYKMKI